MVVKMDIEGMEYAVLDRLEQLGVHELIDEMFCEFHFLTTAKELTGGKGGGWNERATRSFGPERPMTEADAHAYFNKWRTLVPAFHAWP